MYIYIYIYICIYSFVYMYSPLHLEHHFHFHSQSHWCLFIGLWQKRPRELDHCLRCEIKEMALQKQ